MIDYSQLHLVWPSVAILIIGLVSGWFLQRFLLVRQMEELETEHLDLLRSAEDEMHAARDEARLQGQKLDEAQKAISLGYERLTLLNRRLRESEATLAKPAETPVAATEPSPEAAKEIAELRRQLAEHQAFAERLNELERELHAAKIAAQAAAAAPPPVAVSRAPAVPDETAARALRERDATIDSLRHEVASIESLRLRLSDLVSELGLAHAQAGQLARERDELAAQLREAPRAESSNELVRKLAEAIARRQEAEVALAEANQKLAAAMAVPAVAAVTSMPRAIAAGAGAGAGYALPPLPQEFSHPVPGPSIAPTFEALAPEPPEPSIPLLSPAQLAGGLTQLLFNNRVQFAPDRSDILPDSNLLLEDIADLILSSEPVRLVVEGHTEHGDARNNFYLSERRALAVKERLEKLGVPEHRLLSFGFGDTRPIDENASYEGRMRNRRIEIRVIGRA